MEAQPTADLVLVGTVHRDPTCRGRLGALLDDLRPDLVTVEVSPYGIRFRETEGERLARKLEERLAGIDAPGDPRAHPAIGALFALLALPDEYRAALDHAKARGDRIPVVPVDRSDFSERKLALVEAEALAEENLRALLSRPGEEAASPEAHTARARAVLEGRAAAPIIAAESGAEMDARDRHSAARIRGLIDALRPARAVHVCGWEHLILREDRATLRSLLADFEAACALLDSRVWVGERRPPRA